LFLEAVAVTEPFHTVRECGAVTDALGAVRQWGAVTDALGAVRQWGAVTEPFGTERVKAWNGADTVVASKPKNLVTEIEGLEDQSLSVRYV
jgi:hypothetical protein